MIRGREPKEVAKRAIILSAVAFRSSLEVTTHRRVSEYSGRLLPWLIDVGCGDDLDPIEREELATPVGQLSSSQTIDLRWAGQRAALYCWMMRVGGELKETTLTDPSKLPTFQSVLKPDAHQLIESAVLRDRQKIENTCRQYVLIRSLLQESRVDPAAGEIIRRLHIKKLDDAGLSVTEDHIKWAADVAGRMSPEVRITAAGLYFVRQHAALWFFSERKNYFE